MKKLIIVMVITFCFAGDFTLMSWNVENLFDIEDDPKTRDGDFMPGGAKRYTFRSYSLKLQHLADVINAEDPVILAMTEVENRQTLQALREYLEHGASWEIVIDEGSDIRGIDPALMYRKDKFQYIYHTYYPVFIEERGYHSRPIMRIDLAMSSHPETLSVFINHWPSRRGGKPLTDPFRCYAAGVLAEAVKKTLDQFPEYRIIMTGDFNDDAKDACLKILYEKDNIEYVMKESPRDVHGTYCHNGEWISFDHFLVSNFKPQGLLVKKAYIFAPYWIRDKRTQGPLRYYQGMTTLGGYSDHFPICLNLGFERKIVE